jgi:hypothetical protein
MRDFKGMKRQRGRNRGSGGGNGGGGKPQQNANRAFDSNGPEGIKVRGAAQSVFEKYQQLARDAATGGDRVLAENYLQHAEHYYRMLRAMQPTRPASEFIGRDGFSSVHEIDFEAEPEEAVAEAPEAEGEEGESAERQDARREERQRYNNDRPRDDRPRDDRPRDDRPREDRPRYNNDRPRDERPRDDRPRDDRPRDDRPRYNNNDRPRDDRPRDDRPRDDRPRDDRTREERQRERLERQERFDRERTERPPEPVAAEAPREDAGPRLRGQDGAISEAPAFLSRGAPEPRAEAPRIDAVEGEAEAPKKRGRPRKAAAAEEA